MEIKAFGFFVYFVIGCIHLRGDAANGRLEQQFEKCCSLGTSWASEGLRCEKFAGPVAGVPMVEQAMCLETVDICCIRENHQKNCEKGMKKARKGLICSQSTDAGGSRGGQSDGYEQDCCEGCKLGILSGSLGQNCAFKAFRFGKPWDSAFLECCEKATTSSPTTNDDQSTTSGSTVKTTVTTPSTTSTDSTDSGEISVTQESDSSSTSAGNASTPRSDDLCQMFKGLLCSHICVPTKGSYTCACPTGYVLLEDEKTCRTDGSITESSSSSAMSTQSPTTLAMPGVTPTLASMHCPLGYRYNPSTNLCNGPKDYVEHEDAGQETCPPGYQWDQEVHTCRDIDECSDPEKTACPSETHFCVNTQGSFTCHGLSTSKSCPAGFKFNVVEKICKDVDECAEGLHGCLPEVEFCRNTEGAYECDVQCSRGFTFSQSLGICIDIDECATNRVICPSDKPTCVNSPGGYKCLRRETPRSDNDYEVESINANEISNNNANGEMPEKTNRLVDSQEQHRTSEKLRHEPGGSSANDSRLLVSQKQYPTDHEGSSQNDSRLLLPQKQNLIEDGGNSQNDSRLLLPQNQYPTVKTLKRLCPPGYRFNGFKCVDIDECSEGPVCQEHERCVNRLGGYDCHLFCNSGWYFDRLSKACQDVDECLLGRHNCSQPTHLCHNTNGSFACLPVPPCSLGYRRGLDRTCADVDECLENLHNCRLEYHQYCVNKPGGFDCITRLPECEDGYKYSLVTRSCEDVDECRSPAVTPCDHRLQEKCINLKGSFRCERPVEVVAPQRNKPACPPGYRYDVMRRQCQDIDECREKTDICGHEVCYNQPGGYSCAQAPTPITKEPIRQQTLPTSGPMECSSGQRYVRHRGCVDINECEEIQDVCTSNEECVNNVGSYVCNCRTGFRRDNLTQACVDINECQLPNDCLSTQRCDNTLGSYNCVRFLPCGTGYTLNAATEICEDDDECLLGTHDCGEGYHCRNTLGSYRCNKNPRGSQQTPSPRITTPRPPSTLVTTTTTMMTSVIDSRNQPERTCPRGFFQGGRGECVDIDECTQGPSNPCSSSPLQQCINTIGSYQCLSSVICGAGFTLDPKTNAHCVDIDECSDGTHKCNARQTCENRPGGYVCACPPGHALTSNRNCVDIDECSIYARNICGATGQCENTVGSFRCICNSGFERIEGGNGCEDINECQRHPGICQHDCINVWGSYSCVCKPGYSLNNDNRSCSDIDECQMFKDNNLCVGFCDNTPGSYACRCPDGYRLGEDGRTCQDIDECAAGVVCRDPSEMCQNTRGGYRCNRIQCPSGYHRDQERKNRCVRTSRYCPSGDISCYQLPSHYSFNFITFVSLLPIPRSRQLELFTMRGTHLPGSIVRFSMALINAQAPPGVTRATESCFALRKPSPSQAVLVLTKSLPGPQEIELDLSMEIYHDTAFAGSAVAKLFIYVTQYEF
ncbi:fibrillin-2-like [Diachasmimorpha longicaudata]|uniref:fibrillin-2-like n=1 Tax=Diachasmimorpha longicaudata TaxID=58733 RepID=UPI0030B8991B